MCHTLNLREGNRVQITGSLGTCDSREGKRAAFQILLWNILKSLPWYDSDWDPIEHIVFTSLQPLPWGMGQEEEREGSKAWLIAFEKLFPARGRCGHYTNLQLTKPSHRWSRCKLCHPLGWLQHCPENIFLVFQLGVERWAEIACHCFSLYCFKTVLQHWVWWWRLWPRGWNK